MKCELVGFVWKQNEMDMPGHTSVKFVIELSKDRISTFDEKIILSASKPENFQKVKITIETIE